MFLSAQGCYSQLGRFLRASGGVSRHEVRRQVVRGFSPRKRRCFRVYGHKVRRQVVFSAQAEVFPGSHRQKMTNLCFLRASGGVSTLGPHLDSAFLFSPRKRRCFFLIHITLHLKIVFSAQAEVFLKVHPTLIKQSRFLRASGGVSVKCALRLSTYLFSPRKRRCFSKLKCCHL